MDDDNNIIKFGSIEGGKSGDKEFPANPYVIVDIDDIEYDCEGYLIFTTHHVCIMEEGDENGPVTALMIPMSRVKRVFIDDSETED